MKNSGIKRGLATAAVAALAVVGLPSLAGTAHAEPISQGLAATAVDLVTAGGTPGTSRIDPSNDGDNTNVNLVARAGADIQEVQFQYREAGTASWLNAGARVPRANGVFSLGWTPPPALANKTVDIQAVPFDSNNVSHAVDGSSVDFLATNRSVDLSHAPGSQVGIFTNPIGGAKTVALNGTAAANGPAPQVAAYVGGATTGFTTADHVTAPDSSGIRTFSAALDVSGYTFGATNELLALARVGAAGTRSDDAEALKAYAQTVGSIDVTASPVKVTAGSPTTTITITVKDTQGKPVAGARVSTSAGAANAEVPGGASTVVNGTAEGTFVGLTDSKGQVTVPNVSANTVAAAEYVYWVNDGVNDTAFNSGSDFRDSTRVDSYVPRATTVTPQSADGDAFDHNEYAAGDLKVKILDQEGEPKAGEELRYTWKVTPFDSTKPVWTRAEAGTALSGADGMVDVPLPAAVAPEDPDGTYELFAFVNTSGLPGYQTGEPTFTKQFKVGQATPVWTDGTRAQYAAGSKQTLEGVLKLADGTVLPGRIVNVELGVKGDEEGGVNNGDARIAAQADQPAGTNRVDEFNATAKTDANGKFTVRVDDPVKAPQGKELDVTLRAAFGPGLVPAYPAALPAGIKGSVLEVDFLRSLAPASIELISTDDLIDNVATPGRPVQVDVRVRNAQGDLLSDVEVKAEVDHGFFTPYADNEADLTAASTPASEGEYGLWKDLGAAADVNAEPNLRTRDGAAQGQAGVTVAIGRDAGFDDDGKQIVKVKFTAGGVTFVQPVEFTTDYAGTGLEPLNTGDIDVSLAPVQESSILPDARIDQMVGYRVEVKDSFGNLVSTEVDVDDNTGAAGVAKLPINQANAPTNGAVGVDSQFTNDQAAAVYARSWVAGTAQQVTAEVENQVTKYLDNPATVAVDISKNFSQDKKSTDTEAAINWYTVDFAASTLTIANDETGSVPVGTPVHTTVTAIDQKGQPIDGISVELVRRGPNEQQGDQNERTKFTNGLGEAYYNWAGTSGGVAEVTAFLGNTWHPSAAISPGDLITKLVADKLTFEGSVVGGVESINAQLAGKDNGAKRDKLKVNAGNVKAAGATVKLYRVTGSGDVLVGTKSLNKKGKRSFKVADRNGNKKTKYYAVVSATDLTKADRTSTKKVR